MQLTIQAASVRRRRSQAGVTLVELLVAMVILGIVSTMLVTVWISLSNSYAFATKTMTSRATARDALDRMSSELRDAQPLSIPVGTPMPSPTAALFTVANKWEADFYSAYNVPGAVDVGGGTGALRLTRIFLGDLNGTTPPSTSSPYQRNLYWQRRPDSAVSGAWTDSGVRTMTLATNVVNVGISDTSVTPTTTYTALFRYATRVGGTLTWTDSPSSADLANIVAVRVRLIVDANLAHTPKYVDLSTTLRPRNASGN
jgi:prepilin-type N-terminal cleavage/methylation domain-containing protein